MFSWGEGRKLDDLKEKFWVAALSNFGSNGHLTRKVSTHYSQLVTLNSTKQIRRRYRILPALVVDFVLPTLLILCCSDIQNLRLIQHLMMEA